MVFRLLGGFVSVAGEVAASPVGKNSVGEEPPVSYSAVAHW
jgi:hypothetical protein